MPLICLAISQKMAALGHTQPDVSKLTGVSQGEVSRILAGHRKKVTGPVLALCKYAEFDADSGPQPDGAELRLSQAVRGAIGDNPAAAQALTRILEALAPVLRTYRSDTFPTASGGDHDHVRPR